VIAMDIDPDCIDQLRQRYRDQANLKAFTCELGSNEFEQVRQFELDSCVCLNVLEHIEDDVAALKSMASVLSPGGVIVLLVPAFPALYGPIDRNLEHHRRYTRRSLRDASQRAGLPLKRMRYVNMIGFFGWWANAHILKLEAQSEAQIEMFDRWFVPLISRIEERITPPFGQSLFAVLQRP